MNERKPRQRPPQAKKRPPGKRTGQASGGLWLYGTHAVLAAIANPERAIHQLVLTANAESALGKRIDAALSTRPGPILRAATAQGNDIASLLPRDALHQGLAARVTPLPNRDIADVVSGEPAGGPVVVLDRVSDPQNVGAILRSAAVFGVQAVVVPTRHAPPETGALAKAASGALERVPVVRVVNLARALDALKDIGYWVIGLDGAAPVTLAEAHLPRPAALVLGGEGQGLRRLTAERCDALARLTAPTGSAQNFISLNVSNAAAVALYELTRGN
jgi:23S rRNA (guanosine2251-2'-O)-methyltransferase